MFVAHIWLGTLIKIGFGREFNRASSRSRRSERTKNTLLIAGKNESDNLSSLFRFIENQNQAPDEFIFVDDGSSDSSKKILDEATLANFKVLAIPESRGKKNALKIALAEIVEGRVVLTDADCRPRIKWIESHQGGEREVIVGYAPIQTSGLVREFVEHETFLTAAMTASAIGHGRAYMATGRNWSFPTALFHEVGGFEGIEKGISGDDDLLLQKMLSRDGVSASFVFDRESWVYSDGPNSLSEWIHQKRRHSSAGRYYSKESKYTLGFIQVTNILLWLTPFFNGAFVLLLGLILKYYFTHGPARLAFAYNVSFPRFIVREFLYVLYNLFVIPFGLLFPPKKW